MKLFACAALAAILVSSIGLTQEAKIMILERGDTAKLKTAYQDFKAAQEAWEKTKLDVAKKYTTEKGKVLDGWEKVDYSVDFRAVVPHRELSYNSWLGHNNVVLSSSGTGTVTAVPITSSSTITLSGEDGTTANLTPENGQLTVDVRKDLKTVEDCALGVDGTYIKSAGCRIPDGRFNSVEKK